jgi:hypothetical protein
MGIFGEVNRFKSPLAPLFLKGRILNLMAVGIRGTGSDSKSYFLKSYTYIVSDNDKRWRVATKKNNHLFFLG